MSEDCFTDLQTNMVSGPMVAIGGNSFTSGELLQIIGQIEASPGENKSIYEVFSIWMDPSEASDVTNYYFNLYLSKGLGGSDIPIVQFVADELKALGQTTLPPLPTKVMFHGLLVDPSDIKATISALESNGGHQVAKHLKGPLASLDVNDFKKGPGTVKQNILHELKNALPESIDAVAESIPIGAPSGSVTVLGKTLSPAQVAQHVEALGNSYGQTTWEVLESINSPLLQDESKKSLWTALTNLPEYDTLGPTGTGKDALLQHLQKIDVGEVTTQDFLEAGVTKVTIPMGSMNVEFTVDELKQAIKYFEAAGPGTTVAQVLDLIPDNPLNEMVNKHAPQLLNFFTADLPTGSDPAKDMLPHGLKKLIKALETVEPPEPLQVKTFLGVEVNDQMMADLLENIKGTTFSSEKLEIITEHLGVPQSYLEKAMDPYGYGISDSDLAGDLQIIMKDFANGKYQDTMPPLGKAAPGPKQIPDPPPIPTTPVTTPLPDSGLKTGSVYGHVFSEQQMKAGLKALQDSPGPKVATYLKKVGYQDYEIDVLVSAAKADKAPGTVKEKLVKALQSKLDELNPPPPPPPPPPELVKLYGKMMYPEEIQATLDALLKSKGPSITGALKAANSPLLGVEDLPKAVKALDKGEGNVKEKLIKALQDALPGQEQFQGVQLGQFLATAQDAQDWLDGKAVIGESGNAFAEWIHSVVQGTVAGGGSLPDNISKVAKELGVDLPIGGSKEKLQVLAKFIVNSSPPLSPIPEPSPKAIKTAWSLAAPGGPSVSISLETPTGTKFLYCPGDVLQDLNEWHGETVSQDLLKATFYDYDPGLNTALENKYGIKIVKVEAPPIPAPKPLAPADLVTPSGRRLMKAAKQPSLGGTHPKVVFVDEDGTAWMFKPSPEANWRAEIEDGAHDVSRILGFDVADSELVTYEGKFGQIQRMFDATGTTKGKGSDLGSLTQAQREDIAAGHVLDWLLDNDDAHDENFMILRNGRIVTIDKGRAWKHFGANPLQRGRFSTNARVLYEDLYRYADKASRDDLDRMYLAAKRAARKAAGASDAELEATLRRILANRPERDIKTDQLIRKILERKNGVEADFDRLWGEIYRARGLEIPELPAPGVGGGFDEIIGHEVGLSDSLVEKIQGAGSHGTSTLWGGTHLEQGSELFWMELDADGAQMLRAEMKLRGDADRAMTQLLENAGLKVSSGPAPALPSSPLDAMETHLTGAAKTLNHHLSQGDQNWNATKVQAFNDAKIKLDAWEDALSQGQIPMELAKAHPSSTAEDLLEAVQSYQSQVKMIDQSYASLTKTPKFVEKAKVKASKPAPEAETKLPGLPPGTKVERVSQTFQVTQDLAHPVYDPKTGMSDASAAKVTKRISASVYQIDLPDGTRITYLPTSEGIVAEAGRLRITVPKWDGRSLSPIEQAHEVLRSAGIELGPATPEDVEVMYWRMVEGFYRDRKPSPESKQLLDALTSEIKPSMTTRQEIEARQAIYEKVFGKVERDVWKPQDRHGNLHSPQTPTGKPVFTMPQRNWQQIWDSIGKTMPTSAETAEARGARKVRSSLVKSGGMMSTEERLRVLKYWAPTMSPESDMESGGANYIFARVHGGAKAYSGRNDFYFNPEAMDRISTVSFTRDVYGRVSTRQSLAASTLDQIKKDNKATDNETNFLDGMTILDDLELMVFEDSDELAEVLGFLHDLGIHEIRGLKIEDRFVMRRDEARAFSKVSEKWKADRGVK